MASTFGEHARSLPAPASASDELQRIGVAAVQLGALGPALARLADDMTAQSRDQAARATAVAEHVDALSHHLEVATRELRGSSAEVERALATVARIADHTRILAINASIEANRAGEHGRPFAIVVQEVQRLADRTAQTTDDIERRVQDMHTSITRVTAIAGGDHGPASSLGGDEETDQRSVGHVNHEVQGIAAAAHAQLTHVQTLKSLGHDVKAGTDALLRTVGTFRFAAHVRAEREVTALAGELAAIGPDRPRLESAMALWIERHPHFELVYLTNPAGRQVVDNIAGARGRVRRDPKGFDREWASRPWYRTAIVTDRATSTDLYRSTATSDFCFTVAIAIRDPRGEVRGVLGADVNFQQLVER